MVVQGISSLFGQNSEGKLVCEVFFKSGGIGQTRVLHGTFITALYSADRTKIITKTFGADERAARLWLIEHESEV